MGIRDKPIAPGSPWQNASAERLIRSLLRECVDHMVVVFAENLVRLEYLGIADRKGLALANSQRPPGSYAERPWDELPGSTTATSLTPIASRPCLVMRCAMGSAFASRRQARSEPWARTSSSSPVRMSLSTAFRTASPVTSARPKRLAT